jgi:hypothetical protein
VDWIKENEAAGRPSYASVQPYHAYEEPLCIEKTFYDFDCKEDRERAGDDAHDFARRLRRFYGVEPLIAFSGNKGYPVYPFLEEPFGMGLSKPMLKAVYGWLQKMLLGNAKYETLGSSVLGDIAQLARVPYTHHEKTGRLCRPIDFRDLSHYREHGVTLDLCGRALNAVEEEKRETPRPTPGPPQPRSYDGPLRPCIQDALSRSHLSHKMRIALAAELHADGWGVSRIVDAFAGFADFDRRTTEYQVLHIVKGGYSPFKCSTIQNLGECLLEKCPIYRRKRPS